MTARAPETKQGRDIKLDLFRGLSLFIILIDHTRGNVLSRWTPGNFGLSDAASVFIFVSGYTVALAFWPRIPRLRLDAGHSTHAVAGLAALHFAARAAHGGGVAAEHRMAHAWDGRVRLDAEAGLSVHRTRRSDLARHHAVIRATRSRHPAGLCRDDGDDPGSDGSRLGRQAVGAGMLADAVGRLATFWLDPAGRSVGRARLVLRSVRVAARIPDRILPGDGLAPGAAAQQVAAGCGDRDAGIRPAGAGGARL